MRRIFVFVCLIAVAAVITGVVIARPHRRVSPLTPGTTVPREIVVDDRRVDPEPARRAAVGAVIATGSVVMAGPLTRHDLIARLATERFTPTLTGRTNDLIRGLRPDSELSVVALERPLTATATAEADGSVTVKVWSVFVIAVSRQAPARQAWHTVTLTMREVRGSWLVDDWQSSPGPSPAASMETGDSGFDAIAVTVSWPSVDGAGRAAR